MCLSQHARTHCLDVTAALGASGDTGLPAEDESSTTLQAGSRGGEQRALGREMCTIIHTQHATNPGIYPDGKDNFRSQK